MAAYSRAYWISGSVSETSRVSAACDLRDLPLHQWPKRIAQSGCSSHEKSQRSVRERNTVLSSLSTVGDKEMIAVQAEPLRRSVDFDTAFAGEVVADPHIMVSGKKDDPHAPVGQLGQLAQRPHEALRHDLAVFEPEVEKVADQKYRLRILRRIVEPSHETAFGFPGERLTACAQMDVGCEIMVHKSF